MSDLGFLILVLKIWRYSVQIIGFWMSDFSFIYYIIRSLKSKIRHPKAEIRFLKAYLKLKIDKIICVEYSKEIH
ncbi:hypothetical protein ABID42_004546 [Arcicella rosea]